MQDSFLQDKVITNEGGKEMHCRFCGAECSDDMSFCKDCGAPLKKSVKKVPVSDREYADNSIPAPNYAPTPNYVPVQPNYNTIPEEYKPISMWGYFGYELLFAIPLVGFILLLVFSFGGTQNKNLKNFARSYFCFLIILVILVAVLIAAGYLGVLGLSSAYPSYRYY